jgi:hypothetical protein
MTTGTHDLDLSSRVSRGPSGSAMLGECLPHNGPTPHVPHDRLILVTGQEGAGKSTIVRALLPHTPSGARIDAEDLGQTNPCPMDDAFFALLGRNVAGLVENFWAAGYRNVIAGSFLRDHADYLAFRRLLTRPALVFLAELLVDKTERDHRRATRAKHTTQERRDMVDLIPEDLTIRSAPGADYRYVPVDTTGLKITDTVDRIKDAIPEVYNARIPGP